MKMVMEGVMSTYFRGVAEGKRSDFYAPSLVFHSHLRESVLAQAPAHAQAAASSHS
jgi:hypothetical protein